MARGRMLSKVISLDEKVDALSDDTARLLFTWMISHLDVEGRMYGDARIFKSIVAPRRNYSIKKVEKVLTEMDKLGLVVRYEVNENRYLFVPHFDKHQIGLRKDKEAQSQIPPPNSDLIPDQRRTKDQLTPLQIKKKLKRKEKKVVGSSNIYSLYEQEIGDLTPLITEELKAAEEIFGADLIEKAIREAVKANVKKWTYIAGILENWRQESKCQQKDFIAGQSIEKAIRAARGELEATPANVKKFQKELDRRGIPWRVKEG